MTTRWPAPVTGMMTPGPVLLRRGLATILVVLLAAAAFWAVRAIVTVPPKTLTLVVRSVAPGVAPGTAVEMDGLRIGEVSDIVAVPPPPERGVEIGERIEHGLQPGGELGAVGDVAAHAHERLAEGILQRHPQERATAGVADAGVAPPRVLGVETVLADRGAEGVVLAGTELGLLLEEDDCPVPLHDTTAVHVDEALTWMLAEG